MKVFLSGLSPFTIPAPTTEKINTWLPEIGSPTIVATNKTMAVDNSILNASEGLREIRLFPTFLITILPIAIIPNP